MGTRHVVHCEVNLECIDGVAVELRHVLPKEWIMTRESDSFIVRGKLVADWEKQMWDVIQFVVYPQFLSLQRTRKDATEVRYEMVSASHSGLAFRIEFIFTNSG